MAQQANFTLSSPGAPGIQDVFLLPGRCPLATRWEHRVKRASRVGIANRRELLLPGNIELEQYLCHVEYQVFQGGSCGHVRFRNSITNYDRLKDDSSRAETRSSVQPSRSPLHLVFSCNDGAGCRRRNEAFSRINSTQILFPTSQKFVSSFSVAGGVQAHQFRIEQLSRPLVTRILTTIITLLRSPRRT